MKLTLKNYTKELSKELLQLATKGKVRECDETEKGVFVAYVDEGSDSFDVSLTVLPNGEITKSSCDCRNGTTFCRHKAAMLVHLASGKKIVNEIKIKKKQSKAETLLDQAEFNALKEWVKNLIQKNKDAELSFISSFSPRKQYYSPDEVTKLINEAVKASGCTKKKADVSQVKKLVELLGEVLQPVVQYYQSNVTDKEAFESYHTLVDQCLELHYSIHTGVRILRYVEDLMQQSELALNALQHEESWLLAADNFKRHIAYPSGAIRIHYALQLQKMIDAAPEGKRIKLINSLTDQYKALSAQARLNWEEYTKIIFAMVKSNNLFHENYKIFKPLVFENAFNEELIELLIEMNQLELARKYCKAQIAANYQEQYNVPYLELLKKIYTIENDETNLIDTLKVLFPSTFDFDAYVFISSKMEAEEKKQWRYKIMARAKNAARNDNYNAITFCFKLMDHEKTYKKMIDLIDQHTPYILIFKYFELMVAAEKSRLIEAIIQKSDISWHSSNAAIYNDESFFPDFFDLAVKYYSEGNLRLLIKGQERAQKFYFGPNTFVKYMKKRLEY